MATKKQRLDTLVHQRGCAPDLKKACGVILAGSVFVNDKRVDKPGAKVDAGARIEVRGSSAKYVSRGGEKLETALRAFGIDLHDKPALDVGASTGGFTDCMLQHGARKVYAVDVGYGQFAWPLRTDTRVELIERTNIRHVRPDLLPEKIDLAAVDVSFISLKLVLEPVLSLLKEDGELVTLIKPQFEAAREQVEKGGVVRDAEVHRQVVSSVTDYAGSIGLVCGDTIESPLTGPAGNREFLAHFTRHPETTAPK